MSKSAGTEPGGTPGPLHLTVAVCTWNRSASLAATLEQMTRLTIPEGVTWELLVVNNASTDGTDAVIETFRERLPVRRLFEPEPGLSHARNRALAEARGEYILFTDDDCFVDPGWLAAYVGAIRRWPGAAVLGGPIEPLFEGEPPAWIPRVMHRVGPAYGRQTFGELPVELNLESVSAGPYGGNMAMRREALLQFSFDPALGVRHGEYDIGEETELIRKMLGSGLSGWWIPEALVRHWIPRSSQTLDHVRRWAVGQGRYLGQFPELDASLPENRALRLYLRLLRYEATFRVRRRCAPPEVWIRDLVRASHARGRLLYRSGH